MEHSARLLRLFNLEDRADWTIGSYSAGQQKKISLCAALVTEAPYLLLDEPFSGGLDTAGIVALKRVLKRLADSEHRTVVLTTPVPEVIEEIAERVLIIRDGRVAAYDTVEGLKRTAGTGETLETALAQLLSPETAGNLDSYFEEEPS
jgi:ABC-type multidrug transport system ATPase subunit